MEDYYSTDALFMTGNQYLAHHDVKGMHWGVRRYQNSDGSLTSAGRRKIEKYQRKEFKRLNKTYDPTIRREQKRMDRTINKIGKELTSGNPNQKKVQKLRDRLQRSTTSYAYSTMAKALESKAIKNATLSSISAERKAVGKARIKAALVNAGGIALAGAGGVGVLTSGGTSMARTRSRISDAQFAKTYRKAGEFASKNTAKLFGETGTRRKIV